MKKILLFILLLIVPFLSVNAATITTAKYSNDKLSINGHGDGEVQIVLFDKNKEPIYMSTVTTKDGKFSAVLPSIIGLQNGDYTFKVADYNGKNTDEKVVTVAGINNPKTYDGITKYIVLSFIGLSGIFAVISYIKKNESC